MEQTLYWSEQVFRINGLAPDSAQPELSAAIEAYHPDDREFVEACVGRAVEHKESFDFEKRIVRADGAVRRVVSRGRPELADDGSVRAIIGIFRDVTDERNVQARLQESERLHSVTTMAAGIAHEINNPLQYVTANVALALEEVEAMSSASKSPWVRNMRELLEDTQHGIKQVARIVRDLKAFMAPEGPAPPEPVVLVSVLRATVNMTRNEVRHSATLDEEYGAVPEVMGRFSELVQVFVNLIGNAAQAVQGLQARDARVRVACFTDPSDGWAVVDVEDNGEGVSADNRLRIFDPFFTTRPVGAGTGLGLHVSRGIVERYGGTIALIRSEPGGTCFRVRLPPAPVPEDMTQVRGRLPRLLIVDDEVRVARSVGRMVRDFFEVVVEGDPLSALERIRSGEPSMQSFAT